MKLVDRKRKVIIGSSLILGICFAAYLIYDQKGALTQRDFISLGITLLIGIIIALIVIKIANKK